MSKGDRGVLAVLTPCPRRVSDGGLAAVTPPTDLHQVLPVWVPCCVLACMYSWGSLCVHVCV